MLAKKLEQRPDSLYTVKAHLLEFLQRLQSCHWWSLPQAYLKYDYKVI